MEILPVIIQYQIINEIWRNSKNYPYGWRLSLSLVSKNFLKMIIRVNTTLYIKPQSNLSNLYLIKEKESDFSLITEVNTLKCIIDDHSYQVILLNWNRLISSLVSLDILSINVLRPVDNTDFFNFIKSCKYLKSLKLCNSVGTSLVIHPDEYDFLYSSLKDTELEVFSLQASKSYPVSFNITNLYRFINSKCKTLQSLKFSVDSLNSHYQEKIFETPQKFQNLSKLCVGSISFIDVEFAEMFLDNIFELPWLRSLNIFDITNIILVDSMTIDHTKPFRDVFMSCFSRSLNSGKLAYLYSLAIPYNWNLEESTKISDILNSKNLLRKLKISVIALPPLKNIRHLKSHSTSDFQNLSENLQTLKLPKCFSPTLDHNLINFLTQTKTLTKFSFTILYSEVYISIIEILLENQSIQHLEFLLYYNGSLTYEMLVPFLRNLISEKCKMPLLTFTAPLKCTDLSLFEFVRPKFNYKTCNLYQKKFIIFYR
ncbi:hypothetical protein DLAC_06528 [Tieghemostelium lacteum]|uniref:Uncharacterized protein n=1 Tax=Tieghemostelium lacteum TaxID=361077 RepID=A0A151ZEZ7_TIELA|nr:hypothetical protein DLAC_06528 [Tieghemostelium lacteum]|eukprot:KYQ92536.1 hypothetical protein DLAC_06528 [Tieghemostelium lacteum]